MAKRFTTVLGVVLLVMGLWGMATGGGDHLLLVFGVNAGHNLLHLVTGAAALIAAMKGERASMIYCLAFGTLYGVLAVAGFFLVPWLMRGLNLNYADDFLHLVIAAACLWIGGQSKGR
jgi:hypothetical protein